MNDEQKGMSKADPAGNAAFSEPQSDLQELNPGITNGNFDRANSFVMEHLVGVNDVGTASLIKPLVMKESRSKIKQWADTSEEDEEDDLPVEPGRTYMTHLFKSQHVKDKIKEKKQKGNTNGANIYTDQPEAVKLALKLIGCHSDRNPGGMPIEILEAKKLWFGKEDLDEQQDAEFRTNIEAGDSTLDPKRVRKFVNYDGSLTWEILNQDKTVQSRFTMGNLNGTKIFSQGGYQKFTEVLKKARQKIGPNPKGEFNAIRSKFGGE